MHRFRENDINIAINMTLADLDGYNHPLGFRMKKGDDQKGVSYVPCIFLSFSAGHHGRKEEGFVPFEYDESEEGITEACEILAKSCTPLQHQAVVHLIKLIHREDIERKRREKSKAKKDRSRYFFPLSMENKWGRDLLLLAKAFEVKLR